MPSFMVLGVKMAEIFEKNAKTPFFNTGPYGDPPLKIKISKIGLRHVLSWPKIGLEPKYLESGTFGGWEKRGQTHRHTRFMFYKYRYDFNAQKDVKNSQLFLIFDDLWTFGAQIWPHILRQTLHEWLFYLWDTQSCMIQWEIWFNAWVIWLSSPNNVKNPKTKQIKTLKVSF